jgi:hypothetical protein
MMGTLTGAAMTATVAVAQPVTADQAMENYRQVFEPVTRFDCPQSTKPDEIIVCGRPFGAPDPNRLPLPVEPLPGDRVSGEALSSVEAGNIKEECSAVGPNNGCGGLVPIGAIIGVAVKVVGALVDGE